MVLLHRCGSAVSYYLSLGNGRLEAAGLVLLMSFLAFIYSVWLFLTLQFHWDAYRKWKRQTLEIKLNSYPNNESSSAAANRLTRIIQESTSDRGHDNSVFEISSSVDCGV